MKLITLLSIVDKHTRIKIFVDDKQIGILYLSPYSSALRNKYFYTVNQIYLSNNTIICHVSTTYINQNDNNENLILTLANILIKIECKNNIRIISNKIATPLSATCLESVIKKIYINNNIMYIII